MATVTKRCIECWHLHVETLRCQRRDIKVREPKATNCTSHNQTEGAVAGPLHAILDEEHRDGQSVTHSLPYWRNRRPKLIASNFGSSSSSVVVYDDGMASHRSFASVTEYFNAYLDEYRSWATEAIELPLREQIYLLVFYEWAYDDEWEPHFRRVVEALRRTDEDLLHASGSRRAVMLLLESYFACDYPAAVDHRLMHQSVMDALSPFVFAACAAIPKLSYRKD